MTGKQFEKWISDSCKRQAIDCTRLNDAGWQGEKTERRFTVTNICDFIVFDGSSLAFIEAKKRKQSLRFDELKHQPKLLGKYKLGIKNLAAGYLILFGDNPPVWLDAGQVELMKYELGKKSFNYEDAKNAGTEVVTYVPPKARIQKIDMQLLMMWIER